jgi:hypothetical protein
MTLRPRDPFPHESDLALARERVSFLVWALETHRSPDNTRTALWRKLEDDYLRKLELAKGELQRLENAEKEKDP